MTRGQRTKSAFTWSLGVACLLLSWAIYEEITELSASEPLEITDAVAPGKPSSMASPTVLPRPDRDSLAVILERPLFAPSRRPSGRAEEGAQGTSIDFTLSGVIISGNERSALIRLADGEIIQRLGIGENIAGWTLVDIAADRVIVRRDRTEAEVFLDYAAPAPAGPRTEIPKNAPAGGEEDERQMNDAGDPKAEPNAATRN